MMKHKLIIISFFLLFSFGFKIVSNKQNSETSNFNKYINTLTNIEYTQFTSENTLLENYELGVTDVQTVGLQLKANLLYFLKTQKELDRMPEDKSWQFIVVNNSAINSFCLPGGKVFIYQGLLSVLKSKDELAIVMAHEMAHLVARHGEDNFKAALLNKYSKDKTDSTISAQVVSEEIKEIYKTAFGMPAKEELKYSKLQEFQADRIGIEIAGMSSYKTSEANALWSRLDSLDASKAIIKTKHPYNKIRANDINRFVETSKLYWTEGRKDFIKFF